MSEHQDSGSPVHGPPGIYTCFRATLVFVAETQNITLSLPRRLLKRVKRLAADRDRSVSSLMTEALTRLADEDQRFSAARKRSLAAMNGACSLGTNGRAKWTRDELHER
jgi:predicted transcriptional regulator